MVLRNIRFYVLCALAQLIVCIGVRYAARAAQDAKKPVTFTASADTVPRVSVVESGQPAKAARIQGAKNVTVITAPPDDTPRIPLVPAGEVSDATRMRWFEDTYVQEVFAALDDARERGLPYPAGGSYPTVALPAPGAMQATQYLTYKCEGSDTPHTLRLLFTRTERRLHVQHLPLP